MFKKAPTFAGGGLLFGGLTFAGGYFRGGVTFAGGGLTFAGALTFETLQYVEQFCPNIELFD